MKTMVFAASLRNHVVIENGNKCTTEMFEQEAARNLSNKLRTINCRNINQLRFDPDALKLDTETSKVGTSGKTIVMSTTELTVVIAQRDQHSYTEDEIERDQAAIKRVLMDERIRLVDIDFLGSLEVENPFTDHPENDYT